MQRKESDDDRRKEVMPNPSCSSYQSRMGCGKTTLGIGMANGPALKRVVELVRELEAS